jgi:cold shock CspA family protein
MAESGTCKWFDAKKGYGFITSHSGLDIFVHQSNILMGGFRKLTRGQHVNYSMVHENGRAKASNVKPYNSQAQSSMATFVTAADPVKKNKQLPPSRLLHLTNARGKIIRPRKNATDPDLGSQPFLWTQCCRTPCCPGFGRRTVQMASHDFLPHAAEWAIYYISFTRGRNPQHEFFKFVLAPASAPAPLQGAAECVGSVSMDTGKNILPKELFDMVAGRCNVAPEHIQGNKVHMHLAVAVDEIKRTRA